MTLLGDRSEASARGHVFIEVCLVVACTRDTLTHRVFKFQRQPCATMRRAQSVRHYARPSLALGTDDLGVLREVDESNEDILRRQLLDKDRENDRVSGHIQALESITNACTSSKRKSKHSKASLLSAHHWNRFKY